MNEQAGFSKQILTLLIAFGLCSGATLAASPVDLSIDPSSLGTVIPSDFMGLSYEMSLVAPAKNGEHFFTPGNKPLVQMFQTLGVQSLRVGGNSAERTTVKIPDQADIDSLFGFARAAGVKVIYTLRLTENDPTNVARTAQYIMDKYRPELSCFALGNEPDKLVTNAAAYGQTLRTYMAVINAVSNAPDAVFCGPGTMHKDVPWASDFAREFAHDKRVVLVTQHEYPGKSGRTATNVVAACEKLLSPNLLNVYQDLYNNFVPAVLASGLHYRLDEANSYSNGGAAGTSDAFASALWGLDYLYWWASHGAAGINFHTGGYVTGASHGQPAKYVVFWNSDDGFAVRPLGYAIKAFDLSSHGQLLPVHIRSNTNQVNLTAYAVLAGDGSLYATLINKETASTRDANVSIGSGRAYAKGQVMYLTAPHGDVTATSGVTLGGAPIQANGGWTGTWTALAAPSTNGQFSVSMPAASAAIVRFTKK